MFLWPLRFTVSFVCSSYSEEVILHHNCAFFETSVQPEEWEGCAHVIRITTPFAINLADGRPKSAPVAHWSRWFMCSLLCLMLYVVFDVPCNLCVPGCVCCICVLTWGVLVFCCGCCNGALLEIPSFNFS